MWILRPRSQTAHSAPVDVRGTSFSLLSLRGLRNCGHVSHQATQSFWQHPRASRRRRVSPRMLRAGHALASARGGADRPQSIKPCPRSISGRRDLDWLVAAPRNDVRGCACAPPRIPNSWQFCGARRDKWQELGQLLGGVRPHQAQNAGLYEWWAGPHDAVRCSLLHILIGILEGGRRTLSTAEAGRDGGGGVPWRSLSLHCHEGRRVARRGTPPTSVEAPASAVRGG